jgi:acid phosphatase
MDYINSLICKWMPENSRRVAIDSHPRLSGILDTIHSTLAHGPEAKLPKEFYDPKGMAIMDRLIVEEWFSGYNESQEYRTLGIGSLMGDIVSRMVLSVERNRKEGPVEVEEPDKKLLRTTGRKSAIKLGLSGCHDTTLAAILTSLGAFKNEPWPQFTSHIALELFKKAAMPEESAARPRRLDYTSPRVAIESPRRTGSWFNWIFGHNSGTVMDEKRDVNDIARQKVDNLSMEQPSLDGYYLRIRYNDKPMTVPGCKPSGKHLEGDESFCTLEAFKAIVDKYTPSNWRQDCWRNLDGPVFPTKPEPAGY